MPRLADSFIMVSCSTIEKAILVFFYGTDCQPTRINMIVRYQLAQDHDPLQSGHGLVEDSKTVAPNTVRPSR